MGKGDHNRDPHRSVSGREYRRKHASAECPKGGFHQRDDDDVCVKCGADLSYSFSQEVSDD